MKGLEHDRTKNGEISAVILTGKTLRITVCTEQGTSTQARVPVAQSFILWIFCAPPLFGGRGGTTERLLQTVLVGSLERSRARKAILKKNG